MDESSIPMWWRPQPGLVCSPDHADRRRLLRHEQQVSLATRRSYVSYMAVVCDDAEVQRLLPQIVLANKHILRVTDYEALGGARRTDNIFILRRKSSWANTGTMIEFVRLLRACLEPLAQAKHFIFTVDAAPVHVSQRVALNCARNNLHLHLVPAHMTGLLQPLDTHVFLPLKRRLRAEHHKVQLLSATGQVSTLQSLEILCNAITAVVTGGLWSVAFRKCGLSGQQREVSLLVRQRLRWDDGVPVIGADPPSLAQLQAVWIVGKTIPIGWLFKLCEDVEPLAHVLPDHPQVPVDVSAEVHEITQQSTHPWLGRLRSFKRLPTLQRECSQENVPHPAASSSSSTCTPASRPCQGAPLRPPRMVLPRPARARALARARPRTA